MQYNPTYGDLLGKVKSVSYSSISPEEIELYNNSLDEYIDEMRIYMTEMDKYNEIHSRIIELRFKLTNNGTAPAEDIDVFLYFPDDGFELYDTDKIYKIPETPEKLTKPSRTLAEKLASDLTKPKLSFGILSEPPSIDLSKHKPIIKKTNSYKVRYPLSRFSNLKHDMDITLEPIYLAFPTLESVKSFQIDYNISVGNHPKGFIGKINIKVEISDQ